MPEPNGLDVPLLEKSETNQLVDLVGLSELSKLSVIEFVSLLDKKHKPEFLPPIYFHAALTVEMVVTEDIQVLPGLTSNLPE